MLDCITGGRLISGMVRGIGAEYYTMGSNPAFSHARFQEAHDLVIQSWTRPGPFAFEGKFYHFEYVNVWPRPYQQPHPPIWTPSTGSSETTEWAAHPCANTSICRPIARSRRWRGFSIITARPRKRLYGYTASSGSDRLVRAGLRVRYAGRQGARRSRPAHIEALFNKLLRQPFEMIFPPGYLSAKSLKNMLSHKRSVTGQGTRSTRSSSRDYSCAAAPIRCASSWWTRIGCSASRISWRCCSSPRYLAP